MTKQQFLDKLKTESKDTKWYYNYTIRTVIDGYRLCLITFLNYKLNGKFSKIAHYDIAAKDLGLSEDDMNSIVEAADNNEMEKELRNQLMEALNLNA